MRPGAASPSDAVAPGTPSSTGRAAGWENAGRDVVLCGGGATHHRPPAYSATVKVTSSDRFVTPGTLAAKGTVRVRNASDTLHFMALMRVKKGTTAAQVQTYFDSGAQGPPPFAQTGPGVGMGVQSPGRPARLTYDVPAGTYVMLCFVGDDRTGMPHALMGVHHVVTLK